MQKIDSLSSNLSHVIQAQRQQAKAQSDPKTQAQTNDPAPPTAPPEPNGRALGHHRELLPHPDRGVAAGHVFRQLDVNRDHRFSPEELQSTSLAMSATTAQVSFGFDGQAIQGDVVIQLTGVTGSDSLAFASGTSLGAISNSINSFSQATGVSASIIGGQLLLSSQSTGANQFISVEAIKGDFLGLGEGTSESDEGTSGTIGADFDRDGDGYLSRSEFLRAYIPTVKGDAGEERSVTA